MDECKNCTMRGDLERCMKTPCNHHKSWMAAQLLDMLRESADAIEDLSRQLDQAINDADCAIEHARRVDAKEREALRSALRELTRIYKVDGAWRTSAADIDAAWRAAHDALRA